MSVLAHTDAELGILLDQTRRIVAGEQQALQIEMAVRRARVDDVADWRTASLIPVSAAPAGSPVGSERTVARNSRLLYDVLGAVYDWLGFEAMADPAHQRKARLTPA